jgi:hypothetical protein
MLGFGAASATGACHGGGTGSDGAGACPCCDNSCPEGVAVVAEGSGPGPIPTSTAGAGGAPACTPVSSPLVCDDMNPCTKDFCFGGLCAHVSSQACQGPGGYVFAKGYGSETSNISVATDGQGDLLVAGTFAGSIDLGGKTLDSMGPTDMFVARYDPQGALLWAERFGGPAGDGPVAVAVDPDGGVLLAGGFIGGASGVDFGGGALGAGGTVTAPFVAKLDAGGKHLWSEAFPPGAGAHAELVAVAKDGTIALAGIMAQAIDLGGGAKLGPDTGRTFVAELDATGQPIWTRSYADESAPAEPVLPRAAFNSKGELVVAGSFEGPTDLGAGPVGQAKEEAIFVARYDGAGQAVAAQPYFDPTGSVTLQGLAVDASDAIVISGVFTGALSIDNFTVVANKPVIGNDAFVARFSDAGQPAWLRNYTSTKDVSRCVAANAEGLSIVIAGSFAGGLGFTGGPLQTTSDDDYDVFVAKLDDVGEAAWHVRFGGVDKQEATAIAGDPDGHVYLGGTFETAIDLGGGPLATAKPHGLGLFAGKLNP